MNTFLLTQSIQMRRVLVAAAALCLLSLARADERSDLEQLRATTLGLIQALVDQGLISPARAQALLKQSAPKTASDVVATAPAGSASSVEWGDRPSHTVHVPYIPESVRNQIKEDIRNDVLATARDENWADSRQIPGWVKTLTWEGDLRVRAEGDLFSKSNAPAYLYQSQTASPAWSPDLVDTQESYERLTLRARFGFKAAIGDEVTTGFRLATGTTPASASQTLGAGNGFSNRYAIGLDRAWVDWEPKQDCISPPAGWRRRSTAPTCCGRRIFRWMACRYAACATSVEAPTPSPTPEPSSFSNSTTAAAASGCSAARSARTGP